MLRSSIKQALKFNDGHHLFLASCIDQLRRQSDYSRRIDTASLLDGDPEDPQRGATNKVRYAAETFI